MEILCKAHKQELSAYRSINEHIDSIESYTKQTTHLLLDGVSNVLGLYLKKAHPDANLIFKGKIVYNPETGKPITNKEWQRLEQAIMKFLNIEKKQLVTKINNNAYWLGSLLKRMSLQKRISTPLKNIDLSKSPDMSFLNEVDKDLIDTTERLTGIYIQNISDRARSKVNAIITEGTRQRKPKHKIFQEIWDQKENINRDWERVIRTETAMNANNALLITTLRTSEEKHIFMKGVSAPNACKYCQELVSDQVVVLLPAPPKGGGEMVTIDGKNYPAIWPGKSNYGRSVRDYWVATTIHPYCRCTWTEWDLMLEKYTKGTK